MQPGSFDWLGEEWTCGVTAQIPTSAQGEMCDTINLVRCKRQNFRAQFVHGPFVELHATTLEGHFRVCYRHGQGIVTVLSRHADATDTSYPWQNKGIAEGYPKHYRFQHYVEFHFRQKTEFCPEVCTHTSWPWIKITFWDVNVMAKEIGVA
jgi:hypothetical protein